MERIVRKISLEPMTSRFPVCYPSLDDNGEVSYIESGSEESKGNAFYGKVALGINETVCGSYSSFTESMGEAYSGTVLTHYTLQQWLTEFDRYFSIIYGSSCGRVFDSVSEYYSVNYAVGDTSGADEMDEMFNRHGGMKFYKWLTDNYFIRLDLLAEYDSVSSQCDYVEWDEYVSNIGMRYMPYPYAVRFAGKMSEWKERFAGKDCGSEEECCDCVDFKMFGGTVMSDFLSDWVARVNGNIDLCNSIVSSMDEDERNTLIPSTDIPILLKSKIEDPGTFVSIATDFEPGKRYINGDICTSSGETYILTGAETYEMIKFNPNPDIWKRYYDHYIESHPEETVDQSQLGWLSGTTDSYLESFMRTEETVDGMGNTLPGYFRPDSGSTVTHPAENSYLGFMYKPGTFVNSKFYKTYGAHDTYMLDYLNNIRLTVRMEDGTAISADTVFQKDDVNAKIAGMFGKLTEARESGATVDMRVYADFEYHIGTIATFDDGYINDRAQDSDGYLICTDKCTITEETCMYTLSPTESYPLKYYKVNMNIETRETEEGKKDVAICDFKFKRPHEFNNSLHHMSPIFRKEELLPFSTVESTVDNIYIDRGYATALDRHMRIGEVRDCTQLEKYGNGIFQFREEDETV